MFFVRRAALCPGAYIPLGKPPNGEAIFFFGGRREATVDGVDMGWGRLQGLELRCKHAAGQRPMQLQTILGTCAIFAILPEFEL